MAATLDTLACFQLRLVKQVLSGYFKQILHFNKQQVNICFFSVFQTLILVVMTSLSSLDHSDIDKSVMLGHLVGVAWLINAGLGYFAPHETDGYWSGRKRANKKD